MTRSGARSSWWIRPLSGSWRSLGRNWEKILVGFSPEQSPCGRSSRTTCSHSDQSSGLRSAWPVLWRCGGSVRHLETLLPGRVDRRQGDEPLAVSRFKVGQRVGEGPRTPWRSPCRVPPDHRACCSAGTRCDAARMLRWPPLRATLLSGRGPLPGSAWLDAGALDRLGELGVEPRLPSARPSFAGPQARRFHLPARGRRSSSASLLLAVVRIAL